jgi:hypothetical protein
MADIGLSDQDLVLKNIPSLNKLLKTQNTTPERAAQIKRRRRTLKNRYGFLQTKTI